MGHRRKQRKKLSRGKVLETAEESKARGRRTGVGGIPRLDSKTISRETRPKETEPAPTAPQTEVTEPRPFEVTVGTEGAQQLGGITEQAQVLGADPQAIAKGQRIQDTINDFLNPEIPEGILQPLVLPAGGIGGGIGKVGRSIEAIGKTRAERAATISRDLKLGEAIRKTKVSKADIVGKEQIKKGFESVVEAIYKTNKKSAALSKRWLVALGFTIAGASLAKDAIGTYPFAGFIKEEAIQTLGFATKSALDAGDIEAAEAAADLVEEILTVTNREKWIGRIPYLNVQAQLDDFFRAAALKYSNDLRRIEDLKAERGLI